MEAGLMKKSLLTRSRIIPGPSCLGPNRRYPNGWDQIGGTHLSCTG